MEHILVNGVPLSETFLKAADELGVLPKTEEKQKFVQVHGNQELHITGCAVSKMAGIDKLSEVEGFNDFFVEPNAKWLKNPTDDRARVKVYYNLYGKVDSVSKIVGRVQVVKIPMLFLGESVDECWGELQINVKRLVTRLGEKIELKPVKFGRHQSFDPRCGQFGEWVKETKPIELKKEHDKLGTHYYLPLRFYHKNYLPEHQSDWHFEPVYALVANNNFYRIDAIWQGEEITITATLLDNDSSEIPKFLRR